MSFRPPSRSNRPASGLRTAARPNTGFRRLDTANGQKPIGSRTVGLDTHVQIEHRPITQHGMMGMKTASAGPMRKIADRNYYEKELKGKLIEIVNEIDSMKEQMATAESDKVEMAKLEKSRNALMNEVREYEGKLADYNLALDKMRSGADIMNLQGMTQEILRKNEQEKMRVDAIFLERKNLESQILGMEETVSAIQHEMQQSQPDGAEFNKMLAEYERLDALTADKERKLNSIQRKYHEIRESLSSNEYAYHLKAMELQKQQHALNQHKLELQRETNGSMDAEQIKMQILEKVKKDNKVLQQTLEAINATEDKVETLQSAVDQKEKDLSAMEEYSKQSHKYEQLFDRDRKMQAFIDQYEENQSATATQIEALKEDNYGLLLHISDNERNDGSASSTQTRMSEMRKDISFKRQQKDEAQNTLLYSEKELEKRQLELEKINNLDDKISVELQSIDEQTQQHREEMAAFKTHSEIQSEYKQEKQKLFRLKMETQQAKEAMEKKVLEMAQKSDVINSKLNENAYHNELKEMETKISKLSQNIFSVEDTIAEFKREGQYETISTQVIEMQTSINSLLLQELALES